MSPTLKSGTSPLVDARFRRSQPTGAAGANTLGLSETKIANATPYLFDETAPRNAVERLDPLALAAPRTETRTEVAALTRRVKTKDFLDSTDPGGFADQPPAVERQFAQRMGATTVEIPSSHVATVSYPAEVAELIEQATQPKGDPP
jgi:hypothetical protein